MHLTAHARALNNKLMQSVNGQEQLWIAQGRHAADAEIGTQMAAKLGLPG